MATIKSYTDLEQSKKLADILPLESADMKILSFGIDIKKRVVPIDDIAVLNREDEIPCWSLAALLGVLPKDIIYDGKIVSLEFHVWENSLEYVNNADYTLYVTESYNNPVDACVEMILKLHELNLL